MNSMKRTWMPSVWARRARGRIWSSFQPRSTTAFSLVLRPVDRAASIPASTRDSPSLRVRRSKAPRSAASRLTFTPHRPASRRPRARRARWKPLVVRCTRPSTSGLMPATMVSRSRRSKGSPPVRRTLRMPRLVKTWTACTSSFRLMAGGSARSRAPVRGLQYTQARLHCSVTETRKYVMFRPSPSFRPSLSRSMRGGWLLLGMGKEEGTESPGPPRMRGMVRLRLRIMPSVTEGSVLLQGQLKHEPGAPAEFAVDSELASMGLDDALADGETQAPAVGCVASLGLVEGEEQFLDLGGIQASSRIPDFQPPDGGGLVHRGSDANLATAGRELQRVLEEIQHDLMQGGCVGQDTRPLGLRRDFQVEGEAPGFGLEAQDLLEALRDFTGDGGHQFETLQQRLGATLVQKVPHKGFDTIRLPFHHVQEVQIGAGHELAQAVEGEEDRGEGRAEVVGDHVKQLQAAFEAAFDLLVGLFQGAVLPVEHEGPAFDGLFEFAGAEGEAVAAPPEHPGEQAQQGQAEQTPHQPALMPGGADHDGNGRRLRPGHAITGGTQPELVMASPEVPVLEGEALAYGLPALVHAVEIGLVVELGWHQRIACVETEVEEFGPRGDVRIPGKGLGTTGPAHIEEGGGPQGHVVEFLGVLEDADAADHADPEAALGIQQEPVVVGLLGDQALAAAQVVEVPALQQGHALVVAEGHASAPHIGDEIDPLVRQALVEPEGRPLAIPPQVEALHGPDPEPAPGISGHGRHRGIGEGRVREGRLELPVSQFPEAVAGGQQEAALVSKDVRHGLIVRLGWQAVVGEEASLAIQLEQALVGSRQDAGSITDQGEHSSLRHTHGAGRCHPPVLPVRESTIGAHPDPTRAIREETPGFGGRQALALAPVAGDAPAFLHQVDPGAGGQHVAAGGEFEDARYRGQILAQNGVGTIQGQ